jgi:iron complex outermembrane receptor protein
MAARLWRQRRFRDFSAQDWSGRVELLGKVSTGALRHHLLFGVDGYRFVDHRLQLRKSPNAAAPYAIDIYATGLSAGRRWHAANRAGTIDQYARTAMVDRILRSGPDRS